MVTNLHTAALTACPADVDGEVVVTEVNEGSAAANADVSADDSSK